MRISVFGATGMAGSAIVSEALTRGHHVFAASRRPLDSCPGDERLKARAVDVADEDAVEAVFSDVDVAVLAIRLAADEQDRLAPLTRGILDAAASQSVRVLIVGGSAPLLSPTDPDRLVIDEPDYVPEAWKTIARSSLDQFRVCLAHPYDGWVYLSPPAIFEPGERSGGYRRGAVTLLTDSVGQSRITAPDLAIAVLDELEDPGPEQHFTIAQSSEAGDSRSIT